MKRQSSEGPLVAFVVGGPACGYSLFPFAGVVLQSAGSHGGRVLTCGSRALHGGKAEGAGRTPEPVKPTRRDVKPMPRLVLPLNQRQEKYPAIPPLHVSLFVCLTDC